MQTFLRSAVENRRAWLVIEVLVIAAWTLLVGRDLLSFDEARIPAGRDFFNNVQGNYTWEHVKRCGLCALWNGDVNGGAPALADPQSAVIHPYSIATTLGLGVINGAKITILLTLLTCGLAQLWLAYELGVGRAARLLTALIAVAAGHVTGPLEGGTTAFSLSISAAALLFAALVHYANRPSRRSVAILGLCFALLLVSGQGYIQIATIVLSPFVALIASSSVGWTKRLLRDGLAAAAMGILIASPFLVPLLRLYPSFNKFWDPEFSSGQSLGNTALNLVIDDWAFYQNEALGKGALGFVHINYVGWFAVAMAVVGLFVLRQRNPRMAIFLVSVMLGALWIATGEPLHWIYDHTQSLPRLRQFVAGIRSFPVIAGIAVVPLLGIAAIGIDSLYAWRPERESVQLTTSESEESKTIRIPLDLRAVLIVVAALSIWGVKEFSGNWVRIDPDNSVAVDEVLGLLETPDLQWVQPPFGETWMSPFTAERQLKIADQTRGWWLGDQVYPPAYLQAFRNAQPEDTAELVALSGELAAYRLHDSPRYASFNGQPGDTSCSATGEGGNIDISCEAPEAGQLVVLENKVDGWHASVNGVEQSASSSGQWLAIDIPAGTSTIELRYRPWDVWIGVACLVAGLIWAIYWFFDPRLSRAGTSLSLSVAATGQDADFIPYE